MKCSGCGFENAAGIKFCGECGKPLKLKCRSCGFENALGIKFCGECGKPLAEVAKPGAPPDPSLGVALIAFGAVLVSIPVEP